MGRRKRFEFSELVANFFFFFLHIHTHSRLPLLLPPKTRAARPCKPTPCTKENLPAAAVAAIRATMASHTARFACPRPSPPLTSRKSAPLPRHMQRQRQKLLRNPPRMLMAMLVVVVVVLETPCIPAWRGARAWVRSRIVARSSLVGQKSMLEMNV